MKPSWKKAPKWAKWLAMDSDGQWFWYEEKPEKLMTMFVSDGKEQYAPMPSTPPWKTSLEARP
jgi:hypothetical protein